MSFVGPPPERHLGFGVRCSYTPLGPRLNVQRNTLKPYELLAMFSSVLRTACRVDLAQTTTTEWQQRWYGFASLDDSIVHFE